MKADDLARVDDYVSGQMPDAEATTFEEELFAAAASGSAAGASFLHELGRLSTWLQRRGLFNVGSTRAQVDAIIASGLKVHLTSIEKVAGVVEFPLWPEDTEIVVTRLDVDLRGYEDVEVQITTTEGVELKTFRDVTYDPNEGALYAVCEEPLARIALTRGTTVSRVSAVRAGQRETIAVFQSRPAAP